jgi:hypothetical protein
VSIRRVDMGGNTQDLHGAVGNHRTHTHEAHVDVTRAASAGGGVGDEAACLVVCVDLEVGLDLGDLDEDVTNVGNPACGLVEGSDLRLGS